MAFGVSNSFKRGTVKTYSRQRARVDSCYDEAGPRKRIRMGETGDVIEEKFGDYQDDECVQDDALNAAAVPNGSLMSRHSERAAAAVPPSSSVSAPSSPPAGGRALFSDAPREDESELSSVPSSPPPLPSPLPTARRPAFSFLKRKRPRLDDECASEPLSDITANVCKVPRLGKKATTQMQIDLGGEVRKACRLCGMEYIPSVREDSALHSKFCAMNVGGVDMGKPFLRDETVRRLRSERAKGCEDEMVVTVNRKSSLASRNKTKKVLQVVNAELSSADIKDDQLWGAVLPAEKIVETRKRNSDKIDKRGDRFKAFLYMVEERCVAFCLAEKINSAFQVVAADSEDPRVKTIAPRSSSISTSTTADVALLGISRIWTSKSHRGRGLAVDLLECARKHFFFGVAAPKNLVAFSQPTESGGRLAECWFEAESGWHVYRGDQ